MKNFTLTTNIYTRIYTYILFAAPETQRIMSLRQPTAKMSKSDPSEQSRIHLSDTPEVIQSKIRRATTDSLAGVSYDKQERPGVSNLLTIYSAVRDISIEEAVQDFEGVESTKQFKEQVADAVIDRIIPIRNELVRLQEDPGYVRQILDEGAEKAAEVAYKHMEEVYKVIGLK